MRQFTVSIGHAVDTGPAELARPNICYLQPNATTTIANLSMEPLANSQNTCGPTTWSTPITQTQATPGVSVAVLPPTVTGDANSPCARIDTVSVEITTDSTMPNDFPDGYTHYEVLGTFCVNIGQSCNPGWQVVAARINVEPAIHINDVVAGGHRPRPDRRRTAERAHRSRPTDARPQRGPSGERLPTETRLSTRAAEAVSPWLRSTLVGVVAFAASLAVCGAVLQAYATPTPPGMAWCFEGCEAGRDLVPVTWTGAGFHDGP